MTTKARKTRWTIGCFRNDRGKLCTVYVHASDGSPMPYQAKQVGDRPMLHYGTFTGMPYREARQLLLKEANAAGHEDEAPKEEKAPAKRTGKPVAKKATPKRTNK